MNEESGGITSARTIAILGAGNLGSAIARGVVAAGYVPPERVWLTRRHQAPLADFARAGHPIESDNGVAVREADLVVVAVQPQNLDPLLDQIGPLLDPARHLLVSTVTGASIGAIRRRAGGEVPVVRAMPNLGVQIRESMTCLAADPPSAAAVPVVVELFRAVGETLLISEEQMTPATALCACGVAFFLRAIRAAAQGGIEIGFHADEAIRMAAQTAKGASALLLEHRTHPEMEIDRVTTPTGCTIAGLNEMENRGFSSAMIRGIVTSSKRAGDLYAGAGSEGGNRG